MKRHKTPAKFATKPVRSDALEIARMEWSKAIWLEAIKTIRVVLVALIGAVVSIAGAGVIGRLLHLGEGVIKERPAIAAIQSEEQPSAPDELPLSRDRSQRRGSREKRAD